VGVYRRGEIWWIDYYDQNRERVQESSQSPCKRDAEAILALRKSELIRGVLKRPVKIAFREFGERYMEHAKANKRSWLRDEQMYRNLKEFFGSERQLTDFNPAGIEGYKLHRRKEVSGSTVNRELALLKRMFNLAIDWELFRDINPVRKVKFFRETQHRCTDRKSGRGRKTPPECRTLHSGRHSIRSEHGAQDWRDFHLTLVRCGLRKEHFERLCTQDTEDQSRSDELGNSQGPRGLGARQKVRIRFLQS